MKKGEQFDVRRGGTSSPAELLPTEELTTVLQPTFVIETSSPVAIVQAVMPVNTGLEVAK
jgi:hypothetical protein